MSSEYKFYGVFVPGETDRNRSNGLTAAKVFADSVEARKYCKGNKGSRFRGFNTEEEALQFSMNGTEGGSGNPSCSAEYLPHSKLRIQDYAVLRKKIEEGDYENVKKMIWKNPRYLISEGDSISVLKEGQRYNALHVAAFNKKGNIAELLLKTLADPSFVKLLYGTNNNTYIKRSEMLIDRMLNTPEKAINETPLHFASKFGCVDIVETMVAYVQLKTDARNKHGLRPIDIVCTRLHSSQMPHMKEIKRKIETLLCDGYFLPIWRSVDNVAEPIIGQPFSFKTPPVSPVATDSPISPAMKIGGYAGPMSLEDSNKFRREWKKPRRAIGSPMKICSPSSSVVGTPHASRTLLIRNFAEMEKGAEKVGRSLATKFNVGWEEYWSFLNKFIDIRSEEGLLALEQYLQNKVSSVYKEVLDGIDAVNIDSEEVDGNISSAHENNFVEKFYGLCRAITILAMRSVTVKKGVTQNPVVEIGTPQDPKDLEETLRRAENFCKKFSKDLIDVFSEIDPKVDNSLEELYECVVEKIDKYGEKLNAQRMRKGFPAAKVHSRVGQLVANDLIKNNNDSLGSTFIQHLHSKNSTVVNGKFSYASTPKNSFARSVECISEHIAKYICELKKNPLIHSVNDDDYKLIWSQLEECTCSEENAVRSEKKAFSVRRLLFPNEKDEDEEVRKKEEGLNKNGDGVTVGSDDDCLANTTECSEDDETFYTALSSIPDSSDKEFLDAEEGAGFFLCGDCPTKLDVAVMDALDSVTVNKEKYPLVYKWKHDISLYMTNTDGNVCLSSPYMSKWRQQSGSWIGGTTNSPSVPR